MAEDKTFRYGLIVLGFFMIMIGMFIMSADKPNIYITFCSVGVLLIFIGITWSICQCYPKITFTPVDMEAVPLAEKSDLLTPTKQWCTTAYTSKEEAERYEATLPSYEQIQIKVEELGEPHGNQSIPFPQPVLVDISQPKLQAKVEVHRNSVGKEEHAVVEANCQSAPLACLKEETTVTTSDKTSTGSSASSLHSCEDWQPPKHDVAAQFGGPLGGDGFHLIDGPACDGIVMIDAPFCEATHPHMDQAGLLISNQNDDNAGEEGAREASLTQGAAQDHEADDLYYGMKDQTENLMKGFDSDFEH